MGYELHVFASYHPLRSMELSGFSGHETELIVRGYIGFSDGLMWINVPGLVN